MQTLLDTQALFEDLIQSGMPEAQVRAVLNGFKSTQDNLATKSDLENLELRLKLELNQKLGDLKEEVDRRFDKVDQRFAQIDERLVQIDERFAQIDQRFVQINERFAQIDQRFVQVDRRFDQLEQRLESSEIQLQHISNKVLNELVSFKTKSYEDKIVFENAMEARFEELRNGINSAKNILLITVASLTLIATFIATSVSLLFR